MNKSSKKYHGYKQMWRQLHQKNKSLVLHSSELDQERKDSSPTNVCNIN